MSLTRCPSCGAFKNADPAVPCPQCGASGATEPSQPQPDATPVKRPVATPVKPDGDTPSPKPPRFWLSYPGVVLLLAFPFLAATVLLNVTSYLNHLRENEPPPADDPQRVALCERSWKLTNNGSTGRGFGFDRSLQSSRSVWTFRHDELLAGHLNANNEYGDVGSNAPDQWTYTLEAGRLRIGSADWWSSDRFEFQIVELTPDKLVLQVTSPYLKGKKLTFTGQDRVPLPYRNWPPMWLFVLAQTVAALAAHYLARRQPGRGGRFSLYFLTHVLIATSISVLGLINPRDGAWAWLGQRLLVGTSISAALVLGAIGGLIHRQHEPNRTSGTLPPALSDS